MPGLITREAEDFLEELAKALDVPPSRYEEANRRYQSFGQWLKRDASSLRAVDCEVYLQGSFRLGTAIRPSTGEDHFDLDIVCQFDVDKSQWSQAKLKRELGTELKSYAVARRLDNPEEWERCWTLNYSDEAQFHMDILPCVPEADLERRYVSESGVDWNLAAKSVGITDTAHPLYARICDNWNTSNPNGFAEWFYSRMKPIFVAKRKAMMLAEAKVEITDIPTYRVKTPLQSAIQILKRHRDLTFTDDPDHRPSSIIITTLSAHSYQQEGTISGALLSILERMEHQIDEKDGVDWIANPSNKRENFADSWAENKRKREGFFEWVRMARDDFSRASQLSQDAALLESLSPRLGRQVVEAAFEPIEKRRASGRARSVRPTLAQSITKIRSALHRQAPEWPVYSEGRVRIKSATLKRSGFRPHGISNGEFSVPKFADITFRAQTNVTQPFKVYWQVVNTGPRVSGRELRGGFDEGSVSSGDLTKTEPTKYSGTHSIECFIVKDGYVRAQSGPFVIHID